MLAESGGGGGEHFPKPPADAEALSRAAGKLKAVAGGFDTAAGGITTTTNQALSAPWRGPSTVTFVSARNNLHTLSSTNGGAVGKAATATTTFARLVHDVNSDIDGYNRQYERAMTAADTAAAKAPANSTSDPYSHVDALDKQLRPLYDAAMAKFKKGSKTYVSALADTVGTDPGTMIKYGVHPEKAALESLAKALGPGALGFYYLISGGKGIKGLGGQFANYYSWISNGMKSQVASFFGRSKTLNWLFDLKDAAAKYEKLSQAGWDKFFKGSSELSASSTKLLSKLGASEGALSKLGAAKGILGKVAMPATAITGGVDLVTGGGDTGAHGVATRVMGGIGMAGGVVGTLGMIGIVSNPVTLGIAGGAVLAYGAYSLGNTIYKHREAIWSGMKSAAHTAEDVADDVGHAVTHPVDTIKKLKFW